MANPLLFAGSSRKPGCLTEKSPNPHGAYQASHVIPSPHNTTTNHSEKQAGQGPCVQNDGSNQLLWLWVSITQGTPRNATTHMLQTTLGNTRIQENGLSQLVWETLAHEKGVRMDENCLSILGLSNFGLLADWCCPYRLLQGLKSKLPVTCGLTKVQARLHQAGGHYPEDPDKHKHHPNMVCTGKPCGL